MNAPSSDESKDPLQSIIGEILDAEGRGQSIDRETLFEAYPEHADSLRTFFAGHDQMREAASEDQTIAPSQGAPVDDATLPPSPSDTEDATIAPGTTTPANTTANVGTAMVGDKVRYFGDYELVEEIARGGMGVVFKSRQLNLNRVVALKMILSGQLASEEDVQRFQTEAEAAANLDHPGIVPIFEIGEHAGQHYFSMGYVEGESLAARVADGPIPAAIATDLTKKISAAMDYAHQRGVIHRDLKPANILLDGNDQPKITDFGLAKKTEADSNLTGTGQILGTPSYMAPEQAGGKVDETGPLADVYAIGAILYCLLSGRPPFQAASAMDTLLQVLDQEPISLRQLDATIPADLETICQKCLNKDPKKRYPSAGELAEELERFLNGEPIHARPVSRVERVWRWAKRRPALAFMSAAVVLLATALAIGGPLAAISQSKLRRAAEESESLAKENEDRAKQLADAESQARREVEQSQEALAAEKERSDRSLYARTVELAYQELNNGNLTSAEDMLASLPVEFRGFEWEYVNSLCHTELGQYLGLDHVPPFVAIGDEGNQIISAAMSTAQYGRGKTYFWDRDGEQPKEIRDVLAIAATRDGTRLAVIPQGSSGKLQIMDATTGEVVCSIAGHKPQIRIASFGGPDESRVATTGSDRTVRIWDANTGKELHVINLPNRRRVVPIALSPDGKWVGWRDGDTGSIVVHDTDEGRKRFEGPPSKRMKVPFAPVEFSPDSSTIAVGGFGEIEIVSVPDGKRIGVLRGLRGYATDLTYAPDGERIAASCQDGTIRIYDTLNFRPLNALTGHDIGASYGISEIAFDETGDLLVSGGNNKDIKLWDSWSGERQSIGESTRSIDELPQPSQEVDYLPVFDGFVENVCLTKDGRMLFGVGTDGSIRAMDTESGETVREWKDLENLAAVAHDPENQVVFAGGGSLSDREPGGVYAFDFVSGKELWQNHDASGPIRRLAVFKGGTRIAVAVGSQTVLKGELFVLDAKTGELLWRNNLGTNVSSVRDLAVSPDGAWIASVGSSEGVQIRDSETGELLRTIGNRLSFCVAISSDGKQVACGTARWNVILMDAEDGTVQWAQHRHYGAVSGLKFVDNNSRLVSTAYDGTTRIWDTKYGDLLLTMNDVGVPKYSIDITEDGRLWAVSGEDVSIVLRRLPEPTDKDPTDGVAAAETESPDWITLYEDDFDREELGDLWRSAYGSCRIENGALVAVSGPVGFMPGWFGSLVGVDKKISSDVDVSLDAWIDSPMLLDISLSDQSRKNSVAGMFIGVTGTPFNFGEKGVGINYSLRGKFSLGPSRRTGDFGFIPEQKYRFRMRRIGNKVDMFIDGELYRSAEITVGYPLPHIFLQGLLGKEGSKLWIDNLVVKGPPGAELDIRATELVTEVGKKEGMKPLVIYRLENYDYSTLEGDPAELRRRALRVAGRWPEDTNSVLMRAERMAIENTEPPEVFAVIQNWIADAVKVKTPREYRAIAAVALRSGDGTAFWDAIKQAIQQNKRNRGASHPTHLALSGLKLLAEGMDDAVASRVLQIQEIIRAAQWEHDKLAKDWTKLFLETVAPDAPDPTEQTLRDVTWKMMDEFMMKGNHQLLTDRLSDTAELVGERTQNDPKPSVMDRQNWGDIVRLWSRGFPLHDSRFTRTNVSVTIAEESAIVRSWFVYQVKANFYEWMQVDHFAVESGVDPGEWKLTKQLRRTTKQRRGTNYLDVAKDGWERIDSEIEKLDASGSIQQRIAARWLSGRSRETLDLAIELVRQEKSARNYAILAEAAHDAGDAALMFKSASKAIELDPFVHAPPAIRALAARVLRPDEPESFPFGVSASPPEFYQKGQINELGVGPLGIACWHPTSGSMVGAWNSPSDKEDILESGVETFIASRDQMFGAKLVRRQNRSVDGLPAIEAVFVGSGINGVAAPIGQGGATFQHFMFVKRKTGLVIFFVGANENEFAQRDAEFGEFMRSVKFDESDR